MKTPVPILLMSRALDGGGSERQLAEVARGLDRSRFAPHVGCFQRGGIREADLREAGVPVAEFPVRSFASWSMVRAAALLGRFVRHHGIRLVHTFDVPANVFGVPVARWFRVPVVISSQRAFRHLTPGFYHHLLRVTDLMVDAVVVNSAQLRRTLLEQDRIPAGKLRLCYNAIDTEAFHADGESVRGILPPGRVIGAVSQLRPEKGVATLIRAFARMRAECAPVTLVLVGDGPCRSELEMLAGQLGIAASCRFAGQVSDVRPWLRAMDIFVQPSLSEALSNSLLEAMAIGCAAVASRAGGNPEVIDHGRTGLLYEAGDVEGLGACLRGLLADEERRRELAEAGRQETRGRFAARVSIACFEALYEELLGWSARNSS
jgi:glycosyltransferase involved in cell wall biosynthesis